MKHLKKGEDETLDSRPFKIKLTIKDNEILNSEILEGDFNDEEVEEIINTLS